MVSFITVIRCLCIFLIILTKVVGMTQQDVIPCPNLCVCPSKTLVMCEGNDKKLTYIPRLPATTRKLVFRGNLIPEIYRDTFQNITFQFGNRVEILDLSDNGIVSISTIAFSKLTYLKELDLSKNYLRDPDGLQKALVGLRYIHVHRLTLHHMDLGDDSIPSNLFEPLTYLNSIQTIDMSDNVLNEFDFQTLVNLTSLQELILCCNRISGLIGASRDLSFPSVKYIDLRSNNILAMPFFCILNISIFPGLTKLVMDDNFITYFDNEDFNCLISVKHLSLNYNPATLIPNQLIASMTSLETLQISSMLRPPLQIAIGAFISSSIQTLNIAGNEIQSYIFTEHGFNGMNRIKTIDLSGSDFQDLETYSEEVMSTLLPKTVEILSLRNSILGEMPRFNSSNITELDLSENKITELHMEDLANYPSLRILNLNSNRLTRISEHTITPRMQDQLIAIGFADNPLLCSCDIAWLHTWMVREPLKFLTMGTQVECISEETGSFILLENYKPTNCGSITHVTLTITIVCCVIIVVIIVILIFCYRKRIKLFCYICTRKRGGEQLVLSDNAGI